MCSMRLHLLLTPSFVSLSPAPTALASVNTFTSGEAIETLSGIGAARRSSLETLAREPAIARVVTRADDGESIVYSISATHPPGDSAQENA